MSWKRDLRESNVRRIGEFTVYSETRNRETAHVVVFPDGREFRVLPDGRSGQKRSSLVRQACGVADSVYTALGANKAALIFVGQLTEMGLAFERVESEEVCETCGRPL